MTQAVYKNGQNGDAHKGNGQSAELESLLKRQRSEILKQGAGSTNGEQADNGNIFAGFREGLSLEQIAAKTGLDKEKIEREWKDAGLDPEFRALATLTVGQKLSLSEARKEGTVLLEAAHKAKVSLPTALTYWRREALHEMGPQHRHESHAGPRNGESDTENNRFVITAAQKALIERGVRKHWSPDAISDIAHVPHRVVQHFLAGGRHYEGEQNIQIIVEGESVKQAESAPVTQTTAPIKELPMSEAPKVTESPPSLSQNAPVVPVAPVIAPVVRRRPLISFDVNRDERIWMVDGLNGVRGSKQVTESVILGILELDLRGHDATEIAQELNVDRRTVVIYRRAMFVLKEELEKRRRGRGDKINEGAYDILLHNSYTNPDMSSDYVAPPNQLFYYRRQEEPKVEMEVPVLQPAIRTGRHGLLTGESAERLDWIKNELLNSHVSGRRLTSESVSKLVDGEASGGTIECIAAYAGVSISAVSWHRSKISVLLSRIAENNGVLPPRTISMQNASAEATDWVKNELIVRGAAQGRRVSSTVIEKLLEAEIAGLSIQDAAKYAETSISTVCNYRGKILVLLSKIKENNGVVPPKTVKQVEEVVGVTRTRRGSEREPIECTPEEKAWIVNEIILGRQARGRVTESEFLTIVTGYLAGKNIVGISRDTRINAVSIGKYWEVLDGIRGRIENVHKLGKSIAAEPNRESFAEEQKKILTALEATIPNSKEEFTKRLIDARKRRLNEKQLESIVDAWITNTSISDAFVKTGLSIVTLRKYYNKLDKMSGKNAATQIAAVAANQNQEKPLEKGVSGELVLKTKENFVDWIHKNVKDCKVKVTILEKIVESWMAKKTYKAGVADSDASIPTVIKYFDILDSLTGNVRDKPVPKPKRNWNWSKEAPGFSRQVVEAKPRWKRLDPNARLGPAQLGVTQEVYNMLKTGAEKKWNDDTVATFAKVSIDTARRFLYGEVAVKKTPSETKLVTEKAPEKKVIAAPHKAIVGLTELADEEEEGPKFDGDMSPEGRLARRAVAKMTGKPRLTQEQIKSLAKVFAENKTIARANKTTGISIASVRTYYKLFEAVSEKTSPKVAGPASSAEIWTGDQESEDDEAAELPTRARVAGVDPKELIVEQISAADKVETVAPLIRDLTSGPAKDKPLEPERLQQKIVAMRQNGQSLSSIVRATGLKGWQIDRILVRAENLLRPIDRQMFAQSQNKPKS